MPSAFRHLETVGLRAGCRPNQTKPNPAPTGGAPPAPFFTALHNRPSCSIFCALCDNHSKWGSRVSPVGAAARREGQAKGSMGRALDPPPPGPPSQPRQHPTARPRRPNLFRQHPWPLESHRNSRCCLGHCPTVVLFFYARGTCRWRGGGSAEATPPPPSATTAAGLLGSPTGSPAPALLTPNPTGGQPTHRSTSGEFPPQRANTFTRRHQPASSLSLDAPQKNVFGPPSVPQNDEPSVAII